MPILFAVVARGSTVLAKYASCAGNFTEVTEQILAKIPADNSKLTYSHGSYLFHYVCDDRIIFLCITDDDFERAKAFLFLSEVKKKFQMQYGVRAQTALPYAMNSEFSRTLASQMRYFSDSTASSPDRIQEVKGQVDELKGIMVKNIDQIADRGEKLELLVDKTEDLSANVRSYLCVDTGEKLKLLVDTTDDLRANAVSFKKTSRNLARSLWWKNIKITIIIVIVVIIVIYFIVSAACGGLDWPCTRSK